MQPKMVSLLLLHLQDELTVRAQKRLTQGFRVRKRTGLFFLHEGINAQFLRAAHDQPVKAADIRGAAGQIEDELQIIVRIDPQLHAPAIQLAAEQHEPYFMRVFSCKCFQTADVIHDADIQCFRCGQLTDKGKIEAAADGPGPA